MYVTRPQRGERKTSALCQAAGVGGGQVQARERSGGGLGERGYPWCAWRFGRICGPGSVGHAWRGCGGAGWNQRPFWRVVLGFQGFQCVCLGEGVRTNGRAAQGRQVAAGPQRPAKVAGESADVRAA